MVVDVAAAQLYVAQPRVTDTEVFVLFFPREKPYQTLHTVYGGEWDPGEH